MHVRHYVKWLVNPAKHEHLSSTSFRWLLLLYDHRRTDRDGKRGNLFLNFCCEPAKYVIIIIIMYMKV
jgi:hypothetical protein